jgi:hypothetical protein
MRVYWVMRRVGWVLLASCGRMAPAPAPHGPVTQLRATLEVPDEVMEFRIELRGIRVATVQTAIGRPGWVGAHRAIIVKSRGQTEGLLTLIGNITWELESTIDLDTGMVIADDEEISGELAGDREHEEHRRTASTTDRAHDLHSAIGALRAWQSGSDGRTEVSVELGGGRFDIAVTYAGLDHAGGKPAVRLDGEIERTRVALWLSDDAARVPLAFRADSSLGTIAVDLVDYQLAIPRAD